MRTVGIVIACLGGLLAYLGYKGKVGAAWYALLHGEAPNNTNTNSSSPAANVPLPGESHQGNDVGTIPSPANGDLLKKWVGAP